MKQWFHTILCSFLALLLLGGCSESGSLEELAQLDPSCVSSGNLMQTLPMAETDQFLFFSHICNGGRWFYRLDTETGVVQFNCMDPMCSHSLDAAAACPGNSYYLDEFYPVGNRIYSVPWPDIRSSIVVAGENSKELLPVSQTMGSYRLPRIYQGNIIAYDSKVSDGKIQDHPSRFNIYNLNEQKVTSRIDAAGTDLLAMFIENDVIYYTTKSYDCYRQPLAGGEPEKIAEKADNIFGYDGKIYYRMIPESGPLQLWRMNPDGSGKQLVLEDAYFCNILQDRILYCKNDRTAGIYLCDLNGENEKMVIDPCDYPASGIFAAGRYGKFLVTLENAQQVYLIDPASGKTEEKQLPVPEQAAY